MDLPSLLELQRFRELEGLISPQYQGGNWLVNSFIGVQPKVAVDDERASGAPQKAGKAVNCCGSKPLLAERPRRAHVSVEDSSYVVDRTWKIVWQ